MHGLGNDFVLIDCVNQSVQLSREQLRYLAESTSWYRLRSDSVSRRKLKVMLISDIVFLILMVVK